MKPLVTIGIPTYGRPALLARALQSVARQDYPNLEVLVADNATPGDPSGGVVESYQGIIKGLSYTRHAENIGSLGNFMFLLRGAKGPYFMWLADDDEISSNYVSALVGLLESDPAAVSAAGHWVAMDDERDGRVMPTSSYPQAWALARAVRFIWHTDDAFFYALHRTDVIREANFHGYSWPNRGVLLNWAYVYLMDVVIRGRVLLAKDESVKWINHDYTQKGYETKEPSLTRTVLHVCRRINVHYLYWRKCAALLSPLSIPLVIGTSLLSFARDSSKAARQRVARMAL